MLLVRGTRAGRYKAELFVYVIFWSAHFDIILCEAVAFGCNYC